MVAHFKYLISCLTPARFTWSIIRTDMNEMIMVFWYDDSHLWPIFSMLLLLFPAYQRRLPCFLSNKSRNINGGYRDWTEWYAWRMRQPLFACARTCHNYYYHLHMVLAHYGLSIWSRHSGMDGWMGDRLPAPVILIWLSVSSQLIEKWSETKKVWVHFLFDLLLILFSFPLQRVGWCNNYRRRRGEGSQNKLGTSFGLDFGSSFGSSFYIFLKFLSSLIC